MRFFGKISHYQSLHNFLPLSPSINVENQSESQKQHLFSLFHLSPVSISPKTVPLHPLPIFSRMQNPRLPPILFMCCGPICLRNLVITIEKNIPLFFPSISLSRSRAGKSERGREAASSHKREINAHFFNNILFFSLFLSSSSFRRYSLCVK